MSSSSALTNFHVFLVSFPGQGHLNPLLRLGKRLADFGLFVTFAAPELAGDSIRKANNISDEQNPTPFGLGMIHFEFFDDGWDITNPNGGDISSYMVQLELVGKQKLTDMIRRQEEEGRPPVSCLINNPFIPWVSDVAENLGIPSAVLWVQSCACFSAYYHYYHKIVPFPNEQEPEIDVHMPSMPVLKFDEIPSFLLPSTPYPFLAKAILGQFRNLSKPFCLLMDTFQELENEIIDSMSKICGLPIWTVGPLFKPIKAAATDGKDTASNSNSTLRVDIYSADDCTEFLDSKPPRSVVYISFGSIVHLKQEQVDELAYGLKASGVSFLWVIRPPPQGTQWVPHVLPEGFMDEIGDKGKIVQWGPQEKVLEHPSVACFVTHCGWNSTMEALASGVPVVAFPQWGDQVTNAKFLVDVFGVGLRMGRGEADGMVVRRQDIERCLRESTVGAAAEEIREKAMRWKKAAEEALTGGGSSYQNMAKFVDEVVSLSRLGRKDRVS